MKRGLFCFPEHGGEDCLTLPSWSLPLRPQQGRCVGEELSVGLGQAGLGLSPSGNLSCVLGCRSPGLRFLS